MKEKVGETVTRTREEWVALQRIALAAARVRATQERLLWTLAADELLLLVREEARALRSLDDALGVLCSEEALFEALRR